MAKILTQEEIDALLSTVASSADTPTQTGKGDNSAGAGPDTAAIPYDFKHPNRVSKDQLRMLENIHDNFAGQLASALSNIQRSMVDTELVSVDQITYTEFITSLKSPSCTYTFKIPPMDGLCVMDFNPSLAFAFVDRLFGGRGATLNTDRELTGIERAVMQKIILRVFLELKAAWARAIVLDPVAVGFETNPQFIQIVPPGETVIVVSLQLNMPSAGGIISVCYPYVTLESQLEQLSTQNWLDRTRADAASEEKQILGSFVDGMDVQIEAHLADENISMRDVLALKPGSIIPLNVRVGEPIPVKVAGINKFVASVGTLGNHRAIRIEGPLKESGQ